METKQQVIYCIINKVNGKKYIGSTIDYNRRIKRHLNFLRKDEHHSNHLQNAFNKYGEDNFEFNILEEVIDVNLLIEIEQKWINNENPEYNMTLIAGLNSHIGMKRSVETRRKISESLTGRKLSPEHIEAMRKGLTGHKQSEKTKKKRAESCKNSKAFQEAVRSKKRNKKIKETRLANGGYIVTNKMKKQISETLKSKNLQSAVSIVIEKYDLDGNLLETYPSMAKAQKLNGLGKGALYYNLIKQKKEEYKGFIWKIIK